MLEHKQIQGLNDYFIELDGRRERGVYFYRINGYSAEIQTFVQRYYEAARLSGVVIEGKIPNPDEKNLAYYDEIMGKDFQMSMGFLTAGLKKWLPRMNDQQRESVAISMYDTLAAMRKEGKNENMLKNAYIKFMCWFYYKFERIVNKLGDNNLPKILYEGTVSNYELKILTLLSNAGCDVVLLQYNGDQGYLNLDPNSKLSCCFNMQGMTSFPEGFDLKWIRQQQVQQMNRERLYGSKPQSLNCTNAWITGKGLEDIKKSTQLRGNDPNLFYNCFIRINGVEDKLNYHNELYQFQLELKNNKRKLVIVEHTIAVPTMEEINSINRKNYVTQDQMLMDLARNIQYTANMELQRLMNKAFLDVLLEEAELSGMNMNKLTNRAVYVLCWLKRYQSQLFSNYKLPDISCFVYLGGCKNDNEALFLRFLARLPTDVVILNPNLNVKCCLQDKNLYEINYTESLEVVRFPMENAQLQMGTAAYHAERELDTIMYQDSGMYRNYQYAKANAVTLQTMYEEIALLWKEELKYRPNFSTTENIVNMPVIFAKVSGVKDGAVTQYWKGIKSLMTEETLVVKNVPYINPMNPNPWKAHATEFYKNRRLQREKIKQHPNFPYSILREDIQNYILDKLQLLIENNTIKGTHENGTEYTIVSTVLNLNKDVVRLIQKFDFTKKNPKLIYFNTTETMISLEDSIMVAFLNLIGFDVVFFVPTGYQNVEKYFNYAVMEEHQIGDYVYDLRIPDFGAVSSNTRPSWREKIFKRGS